MNILYPFLGIIVMIIYYRFLHPKGMIQPWRSKSDNDVQKAANDSIKCEDSLVVSA